MERKKDAFSLLCIFLLFVVSILPSCRQKKSSGEIILSDTLFFAAEDSIGSNLAPTKSRPAIYYGLYSPSDVADIFRRNDIAFDPTILNPPNNADLYASTQKRALALGVYGADLSYIKLFQDPQLTTQYMENVLSLSDKLGISSDFLNTTTKRIEENIENTDSLNAILGETFQKILTTLSEQDREGTAYLIITGGWVEAMYIALQELLKTGDETVIRNIIEQKFALDYLLSSLKNQYNDPSVAYYYRMLFVLEKYYKKTRISFSRKNFNIDHNTKTIEFAENTLYYNDEDLEKIKNIIASIRKIIISE